MTKEPLIRAEGLTIRYRTREGPLTAVSDVDLTLRRGEALGLVGESGSGKSTLGRGLLGFLPDSADMEGRVLYKGRDLYALDEDARRRLRGPGMGLIFQDPMTRLDPIMRVEQHFVEALRAHRPDVDKGEAKRLAARALADVGVPPSRLRNYPHEFSGGMRQRIMIALALVLEPDFLVADEATTSLDVIVEAQILDTLRELQRERDLGLVVITHNLSLVAQACDRVAVMYAGDLAELGDVDRIFAAPAHPYTQGLLSSTIHLETGSLSSIPGSPPDLVDPPPACRFHPRCPRARTVCAEERPPMVDMGEGQLALCWYPGPEGAVEAVGPKDAPRLSNQWDVEGPEEAPRQPLPATLTEDEGVAPGE